MENYKSTVYRLGLVFVLSAPIQAQEPMTPEEAMETAAQLAETARLKAAAMTFDEFKASIKREVLPDGTPGKYIVSGDTPISDEKGLQEYFESNIKKRAALGAKFAVHTRGGLDAVWSDSQKRSLTYCVSSDFPSARHTQVVADMASATAAWEAAADLDFIYLSEQDDNCNSSNPSVLFDINPVFGQDYLARAFFPGDSRSNRNVLIDESSFELPANQNLTMVGILRHELGHTIGARHEHTRPEAGRCFEDSNFRTVTSYDAFSVMHYPQCNGQGDWKLALTEIDQAGVACLYGATPWFVIDQSICNDQKTQLLESQMVQNGDFSEIATISVEPGASFRAFMRGSVSGESGDPDLYVRFGALQPTLNDYDCRPFIAGAMEDCDLNVPLGVTTAHVYVHGYSEGSYDIWIAH